MKSFFNFSKEKKNNNQLVDMYLVKDLYVTSKGLVTLGDMTVKFNARGEKLDKIIVKYINHVYVKDILTGEKYGIFSKFSGLEIRNSFDKKYMIDDLEPLENYLPDKTKEIVTKNELLMLFDRKLNTKEEKKDYQDSVLKQISNTLDKINHSSLSEEEKIVLKEKLLTLANLYFNKMKEFSLTKKEKGLTINQDDVVSLRYECMKKLNEIEFMLPPEGINDLSLELSFLKEKIKGR